MQSFIHSSQILGCIDMEEPIINLVQRTLSCNWRPETRQEFEYTIACATDFLRVLDDVPTNRRGGAQLTLGVLEHIFSLAIANHGHVARSSLRDASRKFRCIVFAKQALWEDVTTLPTNPTSFFAARSRAWWTGTPLRLHLDNTNVARRSQSDSHVPEAALLMMAFGHIRSLIVEHKIANARLLSTLNAQRYFPHLENLVLSTSDQESFGPLPFKIGPEHIDAGIPIMDAPSLRTLDLRTVLIHLPNTYDLRELYLSARTRQSRLRPRVWNKWPAQMVHGLLRNNASLTVLHLVEVVRVSALDELMDVIHLPALKELVVCSPSGREPVWALQMLHIPESAYLGLHIGNKAMSTFDAEEFYAALGVHLRRRKIRSITGVSSMNLSGLLLSPETRRCSALPRFDETESPLDDHEIAHVLYEGAPGSVDVFIAYRSSWIADTNWFDIYSRVTPYINERRIRSLEINPEFTTHMSLSLAKAAESNMSVRELRLWNWHGRGCAWESLVRGLTPWEPVDADGSAVRDIIELMLALYPDVTRILDCNNDRSWSSRDTYILVEDIYRMRRKRTELI